MVGSLRLPVDIHWGLLEDEEFQQHGLVARLDALHTIDVAFVGKHQADLRLPGGLPGEGIDDCVVAPARLGKQNPGDGVQQGGLTRPVGAGDAGQVEGGEVDLDRVVVGEKAGEGKVEGDHGEVVSGEYTVYSLQYTVKKRGREQ